MGNLATSEDTRVEKFRKLRKKFCDADGQTYRDGYPGVEDDPNLNDNILFYTNKIPSRPNTAYIEDILIGWFGDYCQLEYNHTYIQWLFPTREKGMNTESQPLQPHEATLMKENSESSSRLMRSYKLMLDFYGIELVDDETGELRRASNWEERFKNLNTAIHNGLRITRMLKSMGELGLERLKYPLVRFLIEEVYEKKTLPNMSDSMRHYWINTLKDDAERNRLTHLMDALDDEAYKYK